MSSIPATSKQFVIEMFISKKQIQTKLPLAFNHFIPTIRKSSTPHCKFTIEEYYECVQLFSLY